jgi:putative effector of murein hydrolase LrgA (UPF0299 family)
MGRAAMKYFVWTLLALFVPAIVLVFRTGHNTIGDAVEVVYVMLCGSWSTGSDSW